MSTALNSPNPTPSIQIEMRVCRRFVWAFRLDRLLWTVGLSLPERFMAWLAGRSVQACIGGKWKTIVIPTDEVLADACR